MLKFLWRLYFQKYRKAELLVMRLDDMWMQHPNQDNSRTCDTCGATVGIYPDGQDIIKKFGKENVKLTCQVCKLPSYLKDGEYEEPTRV